MIKFTTKNYSCSSFTEQSVVPDLSITRKQPKFKSTIKDYEGLYINYGYRETAYPYTQQNAYCDEKEQPVSVAILENDYLYAEFLPDFGGRLWKLYDKKKETDILYTNDVIRFRNLSIRNAWFSGGVEWNCGIIGHTPFTCSPMYCAEVKGKNSQEVLRFYEFERVRGIYYQMDFWLEENRLLVAVRIENPNDEVVPMYWWSNMATPEFEGGRVIVPASDAYNNSDGIGIKKSPIPIDGGIDVSYPQNIPDTIDYFYDIDLHEQKFIANVNADGYGLLQWSSHNLKGRKLFSWGHRKGSKHWQKMLTDKAGDYVEIQAGLGKTQYECLPMPPKTSWSFIECYSLADIGKETVKGEYKELVEAVKKQISEHGNSDALDKRLSQVENDISLQKGKIIYKGSGMGSLGKLFCGGESEHLEFIPDEECEYWNALADGKEPETDIISFPYGENAQLLLENNANMCDWRINYHLALISYDKREFKTAKEQCEKSMILENNIQNKYLYGFILYQLEDERYIYYLKKCISSAPNTYSICERVLRLLIEDEKYCETIDLFSKIDSKLQDNARLRMYLSLAYLKAGNAEKANEILTENGGLNLLDFREGDKMLDILYRGIRKTLYNEEDKDITVPEQFDFIVAKTGE
uniref:DUF5107 domain-containing protein n=1 Tax=Eubacterium sp. TaxID=142586 RepID=UPI004029A50B